MSVINIRGTTAVDDPEYRYKMPSIQGKVEGRGNGIKTAIPNMLQVAASLHREPGEVTKFFGTELGAQTTWTAETERAIVNGAHDTKDLQTNLFKYIEKFVLCPGCRLPETIYKVKNGSIFSTCAACGCKELLDMTHKLTVYILAQDKKRKQDKKDKEKAEGKKDEKKKAKEGNDEDAPATEGDEDEEKKKKKKKKDKKDDDKDKKKKKKKDKKSGKEAADGDDSGKSDDDEKEKKKKKKKEKKAKKEAATEDDEDDAGSESSSSDDDDDDAGVVAGAADADAPGEEGAKGAASDDDDGGDAAEDAEAAVASAADALDDLTMGMTAKEAAVVTMKAFLAPGGVGRSATPDAVVAHLRTLQTSSSLLLKECAYIMVAVALDENVVKSGQVAAVAPILKALVATDANKFMARHLIGAVEDMFGFKYPGLSKAFPLVLKQLYDADVLSEEVLLDWARQGVTYEFSPQSIAAPQIKALRATADAFVNWLKADDDESDDE